MSSRQQKRIMNEIKELYKSEEILAESGIYFHFEENSINKIQLLFIGNEDTPYEYGCYFFELTYPDNYPMIPPKMKYYTQGDNIDPKNNKFYSVRFNPNLYTNGKVCLSMLNTWNGPGWVPTNTISNVIVAVQALVLNNFPLQNEPGYEFAQDEELDKYNDIIKFSNYKIALLDILNNIFKDKVREKFSCFKEKIIKIFFKNIEKIRNNLKLLINIKNNKFVESKPYNMRLILNYKSLYNYLIIIETKLKIYQKL